MKTSFCQGLLAPTIAPILAASLCPAVSGRILDDFNDNTKTGWTDFSFVPGFGLPVESGGQFRFELPGVTQPIFTASQKTSETFELKEGRTIEFRVDVSQAGAKDSFAVLAFIPNTGGNTPATLAGYGLAKSTTDVLITKGLQKYFVADAGPAAELKNENITLVLSLSVRNGSVIITGKVLDQDADNAVIWQKTVIDTPTADVLADGTDSPAAPYITTGYFTLYCYADYSPSAPEDPYRVFYDNAEVYVLDTVLLDDFNDNTKTGWQDFTFIPGFGLPKEENGQFRFELTGVTQPIFTASQKTARLFELTEGERLEFRVDVVQAGGGYSYPVLAFIPNTGGNSPATLAGYALAKSTTDVLIVKGLNKYFIDDDGPDAKLKNENITLALMLTVKSGSVIINGKVLDKEANDAVLWEKTFVDTPAADVLSDGTDSPAAPYITTGYFTLYCYADYEAGAAEDPYRAYFDNAIVSAPPLPENTAPIISDVQPADFANFVPATAQVTFKVTDDKPLSDDKISLTLNGTTFTTTNGLSISGTGTVKTATLSGLSANVNYSAILSAEDSEGVSTSRTLYFDTFAASNIVIEIEDYNFGSGQFVDNPMPIPEGGGPVPNGYANQVGTPEVDYRETRATPNGTDTMYRPEDPVRMQHTLDHARQKYVSAGGADAGVYDYDVGDIAEGEWLNYTRTFPAGTYEVYLREALANMASGDSVLERVTGDPTQPDQTTKVLGSFLGVRTGFQHRNFLLTDGTGTKKIIARLSGKVTLRLRQVTADPSDGARYENYLIFIPVPDPGLQRAAISSITPSPNSATETVRPSVRVEIQNQDTAVKTDTIKLELNGQVVAAKVNPGPDGAVVTYDISPLPTSGTTNVAKITFKDDQDTELSNEWSFVITYKSLNTANRRPGPGIDRGFKVRTVQAEMGANLANELQRAEDQLAVNSTIPKVVDTSVVEQVINMAQDAGSSGYFPDEYLVPGLEPEINGTDDFAVEIQAWLELAAGTYRFGVVTDDGYKVSSGSDPKDKEPVLAFHNGGPANETFDFVVPVSGFYPFRMIWYERGGNAYAEWFAVDPNDPEKRTLINDPNSPAAIKAYTSVAAAPEAALQSASVVTGPYADDASAQLDTATKTFTVPLPPGNRFFRIRGMSLVKIESISIQGQNLVVKFAQLEGTP
jgi:hypothetical protein